ncbi:MAG: hypothetical protein IEMM0002_0313 [bacterium]|nr:MAG: hypothetical protein IEMM0002_0313 [bacterium]
MTKDQKRLQREWYDDNRALCSLEMMDENNEVHLGRLKKILTAAPSGRLLEVGCGSGWYGDRFGPAVAIDISLESVRKIKTGGPRLVGDVENLPFKDESFGFVYGFGIIHHLENIEKGLRETARILEPGGVIAFGAENSSLCPMNYVFPFMYGNWNVEKGFVRISKVNIKKNLAKAGYENFMCSFGGFAVYGLNRIVYRVTKVIEDIVSKSAAVRKFSGFMYFTAKKPLR